MQWTPGRFLHKMQCVYRTHYALWYAYFPGITFRFLVNAFFGIRFRNLSASEELNKVIYLKFALVFQHRWNIYTSKCPIYIITWIILELRFCWSLEGGVEGFAPAARGSNWPGGGGKGLCGGGPGGVELGEPSDTRRCGRGGLEGGPGSGGASSLRLLRRSPAIFF